MNLVFIFFNLEGFTHLLWPSTFFCQCALYLTLLVRNLMFIFVTYCDLLTFHIHSCSLAIIFGIDMLCKWSSILVNWWVSNFICLHQCLVWDFSWSYLFICLIPFKWLIIILISHPILSSLFFFFNFEYEIILRR